MSNIDQAWAAVTADSGFEDDVKPPAGWIGIVQVVGKRAGVSKKGETYFAVDLKTQDGQYHWAIYKQITKNGALIEGRVKSAKITLRQLGIDENQPWSLVDAALGTKVGLWYSVETKASKDINPATGFPYVNEEILGVASAPAQPVAQTGHDLTVAAALAGQQPVAVQAPPAQDGMAMTAQPGVAQFPPAVPGTPPTVVAQQAPPAQVPPQQGLPTDPAPY